MKKIFVLITVVLLSSCSGASYKAYSYHQKMGLWVGKDAEFLYNQLGTPQHVEASGVDTILATYYQTERRPKDNVIHPYIRKLSQEVMEQIYKPQPEAPQEYYCKTTFVIRNNIVVNYSFEGDECYASY